MKPTKRRVYASYWPERHGTVIAEGAAVSEVDWDGPVGADRCVSNAFLVGVEMPRIKRGAKASE